MKIRLNRRFGKSYKTRIAPNQKLALQTKERINLFAIDTKNPLLKDHGLLGAKRDLRAFSINGDIRIVYMQISDDEVEFLDIGSHNQVY